MHELNRILDDGLASLEIDSTAIQRESLFEFLNLLKKWNKVYNLTSITRPVDMVQLHLLDSLAVLKHLQGESILDVGTGAGIPGIPLAIMAPEKKFVLLDGNSKKTRFVKQAVIELGLANVEVMHQRIENFLPEQGFDVIISRAFSSLKEMFEKTQRLLNPQGIILAQKGKYPEEELSQLQDLAIQAHKIEIPGVSAERYLIEIKALGKR